MGTNLTPLTQALVAESVVGTATFLVALGNGGYFDNYLIPYHLHNIELHGETLSINTENHEQNWTFGEDILQPKHIGTVSARINTIKRMKFVCPED